MKLLRHKKYIYIMCDLNQKSALENAGSIKILYSGILKNSSNKIYPESFREGLPS
jgi:hypothetical protein